MSRTLIHRRGARRRPVAAFAATALVAAALTAQGLSSPATAATTVSPTEAGSPHPVVRKSTVDIDVDLAGQFFYRSSASGTFAAAAPTTVAAVGCKGDNPAGTNNSPRTVVTVTGPDGATVLTQTSPVRDLSLGGLFSSPSAKPLNPQPAPSNSNYRGDFPASVNSPHGMHLSLDLAGKPAGVYTVTTTTTNMTKTGIFGGCIKGTPGAGNVVTPGEVVETDTFDYRPWQHVFKDVLGHGSVSANVTPREFAFSIDDKSSPVYAGTRQSQSFYSFGGKFLLPSDPEACAELIVNCLPSGAVECDPADGCAPRIMVINKPGSTGLIGFFDLQTKAFVAGAQIEGTKRFLMSLGTENDAYYKDALEQLSESAAAQGIDLMTLLSTEVVARNGQQQWSLSLLNGFQIDPSTKHSGIHLSSSSTVQAGVLLDIYAAQSSASCTTQSAGSALEKDRFTPTAGHGYTVTKTDLLPEVPPAGPLGALVSGPVYHIEGKFLDNAALNTATAVIGVDTATDEPNGYPVWIQPFVSTPAHVGHPRTMDFVGTATWSASETSLGGLGCLSIDFMLGTGVAVFNNPLPVGLGDLIDAVGKPTPAMTELYAAVDSATAPVVDSVTSLPVVDQVLGTVLDGLALPAL